MDRQFVRDFPDFGSPKLGLLIRFILKILIFSILVRFGGPTGFGP